MARNVNDIIERLSAAQRKKVEARAAELIAEEMTLQELRRARKLTQVSVAKALGITQDSVSRLEKRSDILLSTLRKTVEVMGGNLSLVAEFPDRAPIRLSGIAEAGPGTRPIRGRRAHRDEPANAKRAPGIGSAMSKRTGRGRAVDRSNVTGVRGRNGQ